MNGMIAWFARNGVAANLMMAAIIGAGFYSLAYSIRFQAFPDIENRNITVSVPYRGSTPAEVEESIVIKIEEAVQDLDGIDRMVSTASQNSGSVTLELLDSADQQLLLDDIKNRVDSINTFPEEAERPIIRTSRFSERVINVVISGNFTEEELKTIGERVRDEITNLPEVTQAELKGVRPNEIGIEVDETTLLAYGMRMDDVVRAIRSFSLDLSAGSVRTSGGEILLRTRGQAYNSEEFGNVILKTREDGTRILLKDVAHINDGFDENVLYARFNGKRAVLVDVYRMGDQNSIEIGQAVKAYLERAPENLPAGVIVDYWQDRSQYIEERLGTLVDSAMFGGLLVLLVLTLFLRLSLALWVCLGIPISFLGAFAVMPHFGLSLNLITMFAFIMVLGIVVDDAIVTGENVFAHMQRGVSPARAAIEGTREVAVPVFFGVVTTMVAFYPLMILGGRRGDFFKQIPFIVIAVLFFSLVETKLILPAHLKHCKNIGRGKDNPSRRNPFVRFQRFFADGLERLARTAYQPLLNLCLAHKYLTVSLFSGLLIILIGFFVAGHLRFFPFPRTLDDDVSIRLRMPVGTPVEITEGHILRIERIVGQVRQEIIDEHGVDPVKDVLTTVGARSLGSLWGGGSQRGESELGEVVINLNKTEFPEIQLPSRDGESRPLNAPSLGALIQRRVGTIVGVEELEVDGYRGGGGRGTAIDIQLTGTDPERLDTFAEQIKEKLREYPGVSEIADSLEAGKDELQLQLKPEAAHLGITVNDLARQVRQAFFGAEAQRIQRGRDDIRVMVRYPKADRENLATLEAMRIRAPSGVEVPFSTVALVVNEKTLPSIRRIDRNRTLNATADVDDEVADLTGIRADLENNYLPGLLGRELAIGWSMEGNARDERETSEGLKRGLVAVLLIIYALLAIPFKSYLQPLVVMSAIPFGIIGAFLGHLIMGQIPNSPVTSLSFMSLFGMLALIGVVVNDSLVLVDYINRQRRAGVPLDEAVRTSGVARFRPILLTTLTTFAGLLPLMMEDNAQARFLVPMAVSLAWGVLFATLITLLLVPVNYLILEDLKAGFRKLFGLSEEDFQEDFATFGGELEPAAVNTELKQSRDPA